MIQNAAAWLVFSEPKRAHFTPLFVSLHWLPVTARIKFKTLMLAYRTGSAVSTCLLPLPYDNLHPLQKSEICEWVTPRNAITERHKITLQNVFIHRSWLVEWTSHPYPECQIPDNCQATPEKSSLPSSLDFCFFFFIIIIQISLNSPCLASICSEQCLKCCITSTSCGYLPIYNVLLIAFLNYKSLWIKASAKCKCNLIN